jgi:hypothetical protein
MPRPKREYSREFTPRNNGTSFSVHRIPSTLMAEVKAKAKREGVSLRALVLRRFSEFLDESTPKRAGAV